jgi:hypothetical protein
MRDRCTLGPDKTVDVVALYRDYRQWCEDNGRQASSRQIFGRDLKAARPELKVIRPRSRDAERPRQYVGITLDRSADHADQDNEVVPTVRGPLHCSADMLCGACNGTGCPWCEPQKYGLPARRGEARAAREFPELPVFLDRRAGGGGIT